MGNREFEVSYAQTPPTKTEMRYTIAMVAELMNTNIQQRNSKSEGGDRAWFRLK